MDEYHRMAEVGILGEDDRVETHRQPHGDGYADQQILGRDATLTPLLLADIAIRVGDLIG